MSVRITCCACGYATTSRTRPLAEYGIRRHSCQRWLTRAARRAKVVRDRARRPVRDCHHPVADHRHGTRAAYVLDRCRCEPCTAAATRAEKVRGLRGEPAYVSSAEAVAHIRALQAAGLGWKRVARLAGIPKSSVYPLLYGRPDRNGGALRTRARPATVAAILAVPMPGPADLGSRVTVHSLGTRRRVQALATLGWSVARVAAEAGLASRQALDGAMHSDVTSAGTAAAVTAAYERLWDTPPTAHSRTTAGAIARTRDRARRLGWAPPMAWDDPDDQLERPKGRERGAA